MEAVSLAGTIVQFTQVGLEFFSRFLALCRSANGTLEEISDKEKQIQALLREIASLEAVTPTQINNEHVNTCRKFSNSCRKSQTQQRGMENDMFCPISRLRPAQ
jgi:hypothetical protein